MATRKESYKKPAPPIELERVQIPHGKKIVYLELLQNHRGVYARVTEVFGNQRDTIMVPEEMFEGLATAFAGFAVKAAAAPASTERPREDSTADVAASVEEAPEYIDTRTDEEKEADNAHAAALADQGM